MGSAMRKEIKCDNGNTIVIIGNNHFVPLETKYLECHDDNDEGDTGFYYKGQWNSLSEFMRLDKGSIFGDYDGASGHSYWSGYLVKLCADRNGEQCVKVYRFTQVG